MTDALVPATLLAPALAAGVWLALGPWRWARRSAAALVALAGNAAAWAVFWLAYRGTPASWRGMSPDLLDATLVAVAEIGVLLVALRAEGRRPAESPGTIVALGVGTSALVGLAFAQSLVLMGVFLVVPTVAAAIAALGGVERPNLRGLVGLAAADVVAILGLTVVHARTETVVPVASPGLGAALVLGAAAAKAGALPFVGTWRLAAGRSAASPMAAVLRAQGVVLAAFAGVTLASAVPTRAVVVAAAVAILASGSAAVVARAPGGAISGLAGAAAGIPFLALGLGGVVGVRAFLLSFPAFLLAAGAAESLAPGESPVAEPDAAPGAPRDAVWRWIGGIGLAVALASLAAIPATGGFPGTWLALALGVERAASDAAMLLVVGAAAAGLGVGFLAAAPALRAPARRSVPALGGLAAAAALLYLGAQPVRLGIGWWLRVEQALPLPELLPSAGAPQLPPVAGLDLLLTLAPAVAVVVLVAALGRGVRDARAPVPVLLAPARPRRRGRPLPLRARIGERRAALVERSRVLGLDLGAAAVVELAAVVLGIRLVVVAAGTGFL